MKSPVIISVVTTVIGILFLLHFDNVNSTFVAPISPFARRRLSSESSDTQFVCSVIEEQYVGNPVPLNGTIHYSDGKTSQIFQGQLAETFMVGAVFCPCTYVPAAGLPAPAAGIWEYSVPVSMGDLSPSPGTFCVAPGTHHSKNNICKNPADFDPNAIFDYDTNGTCGNLAYMCNAAAPLGGIIPEYMNYVHSFVPKCCNGKTEYNENSGCGASSATDYCNGGEFDGDAILRVECRSPDGNHCVDPHCTSSVAGCIAARGQPNLNNGRPYSMNLLPIAHTCANEAAKTCAATLSAYPDISRCTPLGCDMKPVYSCQGTRENGDEVICVDKKCHESEDECLSRRGKADPAGQIYPNNMEYKKETISFKDVLAYHTYSNHHKGTAMMMSNCCKTGGYTDACARPEFKEVMHEYSLCKNPEKFNAKKNVAGIYNCSMVESCSSALVDLKSKKGVCAMDDKEWLAHEEMECPGRFRPIAHVDIVRHSSGFLSASASCCEDGIISDGCDIAEASYVERPSLDMCKDMSMFKPDFVLAGTRCSELSFDMPANIVLYEKGKCGFIENGIVHEKCHTYGCKASREICESNGHQYFPHDENYIRTQNQNIANSFGAACCGAPENLNELFSSKKYIKDGFFLEGCTGSECCGKGTKWVDGTGCIPTRHGMIDACKESRGKWGWTCEQESVCE